LRLSTRSEELKAELTSFWRPRRLYCLAFAIGLLVLALAQAAPAAGAFGYLGQWGSAGSGDGQFNQSWGVATDSLGNVYVADTLNHRIQKFSASGTFLAKWGTLGSGDGQFKWPYDVAVDGSGDVYVTDGFNFRIQKFDASGTFLTKWGSNGSGDGQFFDGRHIATDPSGNVYVADSGNNRVQKFDSTGNFLTKWGSLGSGPGQFNQLTGIAADGGNVYTLEQGSRRVQKFTTAGAFVTSWDITNADVSYSWPNIDVDPSGNVYVLDAASSTMRRYTPSGVLIDKFDCGEFGSFIGLGADASGNVYLSGDKVLKFGEGGSQCPLAGNEAPVGGTPSVTINDGALYTNDPDVKLGIVPPDWATRVLLSNDGGFGEAQTRNIAAAARYRWRIRSSGPERLPKIVYVRFATASYVGSETLTDDIILDETRPKILSAIVTGGTPRAVVVTAKRRTYRLRLKARDRTSGVRRMQITSNRRNPGKLRRYNRRPRFKSSSASIYVRVRDGAGNFSRWRKARGQNR
jgi:hypothetical protein